MAIEKSSFIGKIQGTVERAIELISDATNFPVVDPGYRRDLEEANADARRNAVDPINRPVKRLRIPL